MKTKEETINPYVECFTGNGDYYFTFISEENAIKAMEEYASQFREKPKNNDNEIIFYNLKPDKGDFIPLIQNWLNYKRQKRETYKPIGLKTLIKKFNQYKGSCAELESLIEHSIINNYSGIIWDKKVNNGNQQQSTTDALNKFITE